MEKAAIYCRLSEEDHSKKHKTEDSGSIRNQKAMLLEFTADSCPNCKVLEATVLTDERMRKLRARYGMELIRVDLTGVNAYGIRLLEALGSKSIPLTALFPAGEQASSPLVLRDVYTAGTLEDALEKAFGQ